MYLTLYSAIDNLLKESAQHWDHFGTNTDLLFFSKVVYKIHFGSKYFGDFSFDAVIPMCAEKSEGIEIVEQELNNLMPENDFFYPDGKFNFQSETFEISETIREKVIRLLGDELPYETAVALDTFDRNANEVSIGATIFVLKESQKKIVSS